MKPKLTREVQLLSDIASAFAESLDLEHTLKTILKLLDSHLKLQRGTITLLDPDSEMIKIKLAHGLSNKSKELGSYRIGEGITGMVCKVAKKLLCRIFQRTRDSCTEPAQERSERARRFRFFACLSSWKERPSVRSAPIDRAAATGTLRPISASSMSFQPWLLRLLSSTSLWSRTAGSFAMKMSASVRS